MLENLYELCRPSKLCGLGFNTPNKITVDSIEICDWDFMKKLSDHSYC